MNEDEEGDSFRKKEREEEEKKKQGQKDKALDVERNMKPSG